MAGNEIRYNVKVDASGANRALSQFGRAAQQAGDDAASALDDTASAGEKARAALSAMATTMDSELREAAAAAEALRLALGDAADQFDTSQAVAELNRMGVGFDEIRADADQFADTMRQVDNIRVQGLNDGLGKTRAALDNVRSSSDQSRSVMANLSGNAAQSAFQNLGGNIGDVGVAIGQLAEYAVDGNINMGNLVKLAGPMLGLAAATTVLTQAVGAIKAEDAFNAQLVDDFSEALRDGNTVASTLLNTIRESGDLNFETGLFGGGGILGISSKTQDLIPLFNTLGLTYEDFIRLLHDPTGTDQLEAMKDEFLALANAADDDAVADQFEAQAIAARDAKAGLEDYRDANDTAVVSQAELDKFMGDSTGTMEDMTGALGKLRNETLTTNKAWEQLIALQYEGRGGSQEALKLWNQLADTLGLMPDEMAAAFDQKYNVFLDEQADKIAAAREEAEKLTAAVAEYGRVVKSGEWGRSEFDAATAAYEEYRQLVTGDRQRVAESEEAWDGMADSIEAAGDNLLDMHTSEGRAVFDSLDELGSSIVPDLAKAFDDANGDLETFRRSADNLARQTMTRLQDEFGVSQDEARLMVAELGLLPEQVETFYNLAGDEDARIKLGLLQGVIDDLPEEVQTEVAMAILADDPQAALAAVQREINNAPDLEADLTLDISQALDALRRFRNQLRGAQIIAGALSASVNTTGYAAPAGRSAATAATTMAAPVRAAPAAVTVNVNSAVIGSRFDVMRAVSAATRQGVRLGLAN